MAEDLSEITIGTAGKGPHLYQRIPPVNMSQETMNTLRVDAKESGRDSNSYAAQAIIDSIYLNPRYAYHFAKDRKLPNSSYEAYINFKNKKANYVQNRPDIDIFGPGDYISDEAIVEHLSNVKQGSIVKPFLRESTKFATGQAAAIGAYKVSAPLIASLAYSNPATALFTTLGVGGVSFFAGYQAGDDVLDYIFGDEPVIMPDDAWKKAIGETGAGVAFAFSPMFFSKNINLGGASRLKNLYDDLSILKPSSKSIYPLSSTGKIMKSPEGYPFTSLTEGAPKLVYNSVTKRNEPLIRNGEIVYINQRQPIDGLTTTQSMSNYYRFMELNNIRPISKEKITNKSSYTGITGEGLLDASGGFGGGPRIRQINKTIEDFVGSVGEQYRTYPFFAIGSETIANIGAAGAAGVAEKFFPGNEWVRVPFEISGSMSTEAALIRVLPNIKEITKKLINRGKDLAGKNNEEARRLSAVTKIYQMLEAEGEDVQAIIKRLESDEVQKLIKEAEISLRASTEGSLQAAELAKFKPTTAMLAESQVIAAIYESLAQGGSKGLSETAKDQAQRGVNGFRRLVNIMRLSGDTDLYKLAVNEERLFIHNQLLNQLRKQIETSIEAFTKVRGGGPQNNEALGELLDKQLIQFLEETDKVENRLYNNVQDYDVIENNIKFVHLGPEGEELVSKNKDGVPIPNTLRVWLSLWDDLTEGQQLNFKKLAPGVFKDMDDLRNLYLGQKSKLKKKSAIIKKAKDALKKLTTERNRKQFAQITNTVGGLENPEIGIDISFQNMPADIKKIKDPHDRAIAAINHRLKNKFINKITAQEYNELKKYIAKDKEVKLLEFDFKKEADLLGVKEGDLSFKKIKAFRSVILEGIRKGEAEGFNTTSVGILKQLAAATQDDFASFPSKGDLDAARNFSFAKNEVINRTIIGDLIGFEKTGAAHVPPQLYVEFLTKGSPDGIKFRMQSFGKIGQLYGLENKTLLINAKKNLPEKNYSAADLITPEEEAVFQNINTGIHNTLDQISRNFVYEMFDVNDFQNLVKEIEAGDFNFQSGNLNELIKRVKTIPESKINKWKENNAGVLKIFESLSEDFGSAESVNNILTLLVDNESKFNKTLKSQKVLSQFLNVENPALVIGSAYKSKTPAQDFEEIFSLLKDFNVDDVVDSDGAVIKKGIKSILRDQGFDDKKIKEIEDNIGFREYFNNSLRTSILEMAQEEAGGINTFSAVKVAKVLYEPIKNMQKPGFTNVAISGPILPGDPRASMLADTALVQQLGGPTLMGMMLKQGIISRDESKRLKGLLDKMATFEQAALAGESIDELLDETGAVADLFLRLGGSYFGRTIQQMLPGQQGAESLIAASAGIRVFRRIFERLPNIGKIDILTEVMEDPILFAQLLKKVNTEEEAKNTALGIERLLMNAGIIPYRSIPFVTKELGRDDDEIPEEGIIFQNLSDKVSAVDTNKLPLPAAPQGPPPEVVSPSLASASPIQPITGQGTNQNQRAQLAAAFPFDIVSDVDRMKKAGIGSLMG